MLGPAGFESGFGFDRPGFGFGFKKIEMDSDSPGFGFEVSGSGLGFKMSGFAHHWYTPQCIFMLLNILIIGILGSLPIGWIF